METPMHVTAVWAALKRGVTTSLHDVVVVTSYLLGISDGYNLDWANPRRKFGVASAGSYVHMFCNVKEFYAEREHLKCGSFAKLESVLEQPPAIEIYREKAGERLLNLYAELARLLFRDLWDCIKIPLHACRCQPIAHNLFNKLWHCNNAIDNNNNNNNIQNNKLPGRQPASRLSAYLWLAGR